MKAVDIVKPRPRTQIGRFDVWLNNMHTDMFFLLPRARKIEVKDAS